MDNNQEKQLPDAPTMMGRICDLIRQFVACSDDQAVVLSTWVLHTWVYRSFHVTPYLSIQSPTPQCGKTTCLRLLHLLSPPGTWFTSSPAPHLFMRRLLALKPAEVAGQDPAQNLPRAVFLDDREFTIGHSDRHPIIPFLNRGIRASDRYLYQPERASLREFSVFCPKAFAGTDPLPMALARRCLHIRLARKKSSDKIERLKPNYTPTDASPLIEWMKQWSLQKSEYFAARDSLVVMPLSTPFTLDEREIFRPLYIMAEHIGLSWFDAIDKALKSISMAGDPDPCTEGLQLLRDLRQRFEADNNPPWLATSELIRYLQSLDYRSWWKWDKSPANEMSNLLRPFGVSSSQQRVPGQHVNLRGYRCVDLEDAWSRYLG